MSIDGSVNEWERNKLTERCIKVRTKKLSKYLPMILTQLDEIINLTPTSTISSIIFYTSYSVLSTKYTYTGRDSFFFLKKNYSFIYRVYVTQKSAFVLRVMLLKVIIYIHQLKSKYWWGYTQKFVEPSDNCWFFFFYLFHRDQHELSLSGFLISWSINKRFCDKI